MCNIIDTELGIEKVKVCTNMLAILLFYCGLQSLQRMGGAYQLQQSNLYNKTLLTLEGTLSHIKPGSSKHCF